jgi:agmatinase
MNGKLNALSNHFVPPEATRGKYSFADLPTTISFEKSNAVIYGVPFEMTTSFGQGTFRGPEAMRLTSAKQVESFLFEEGFDISERAGIFDIGDLKIPSYARRATRRNLTKIAHALYEVGSKITKITSLLYQSNKVPVMMGGEHTLSYYSIKALSDLHPVVLHFDAHRDMKPKYQGLKMCHTTPFYHLMNDGFIPGNDIIQIGIRQSDKEENEISKQNQVATYDAWKVHESPSDLITFLGRVTKNASIYISFDIDVYDISYVPCTGTPEPFGLDPFEISLILRSICTSAKLIGFDMVEVSLKNDDYREATLASQTMFRILSLLRTGN